MKEKKGAINCNGSHQVISYVLTLQLAKRTKCLCQQHPGVRSAAAAAGGYYSIISHSPSAQFPCPCPCLLLSKHWKAQRSAQQHCILQTISRVQCLLGDQNISLQPNPTHINWIGAWGNGSDHNLCLDCVYLCVWCGWN